MTVAGGIFDIGGNMTEAGLLEVNGGSVIDSVGGGEINAQNVAMRSGTVSAVIAGDIVVSQVGPGTTVLSGVNTYTGGTSISGGQLTVTNVHALGTGEVAVGGGKLMNASGQALSNKVTFDDAVSEIKAEIAEGSSYAGMVTATSNLGYGRPTTASVQAGTASAAVTLATSFATTSAATNDAIRLSDVYSFTGTGADIFVLELSMTSVEAGSYLAWLDTATNQWVNAVEGNTGNNATAAQQGFAGSFAAFQSIYGTQLDSYLGAYGTDASTGSAWAVINHNSDFSHRARAVDLGSGHPRRSGRPHAAPEDGGSGH